MKRTTYGLTAMLVSLLLGMVVTISSLLSMGGRLDSTALTAFSLPTILVSCLDPLAILLEIAAIVLILLGSRQVGGLHHRLAWAAAILFAIWGIANLGVFIPLSFLGMQRGSMTLVKAGQFVKAGVALLQYSVPFLLVFSLTRKWSRALLWLALLLTVIGNFGVVMLTISGIRLEPLEIPGQTMYTPSFDVDYTVGTYPFLLALGYLGGLLYILVYTLLTWRSWSGVSKGESS